MIWKSFRDKINDRYTDPSKPHLNSKIEKLYQHTLKKSQMGRALRDCYEILNNRNGLNDIYDDQQRRDIFINKICVGIGNERIYQTKKLNIFPYHTLIECGNLNIPTTKIVADHSATVNRAVKVNTSFIIINYKNKYF